MAGNKEKEEGRYGGFPTRMVYLYCISCLRYTVLVGNPQYYGRVGVFVSNSVDVILWSPLNNPSDAVVSVVAI